MRTNDTNLSLINHQIEFIKKALERDAQMTLTAQMKSVKTKH